MVGMRYLVTGGAGFIGSHVCDALLATGHSVIALDDLSTGSLANLAGALENSNFGFVEGSVLDEAIVESTMRECDAVVHLAAAVGVRLILDEPLRSFTTNIHGTEVVIAAATVFDRPILLASTSEVYGKNTSMPLAETADTLLGPPTVARWAYATAKATDEILAYVYHRERGLRSTVVRLFNTVGPRQRDTYGMVVPRLVRQALAGEPVTVFGGGMQTRCFCHVADTVDAITYLLAADAAGEVFNVGSTEEVTILDLASTVIERLGSASPIVHVPYEDAYGQGFEDLARRVPDVTKIEAWTGWSAQRTLDTIIEDVATAMRRDFSAPAPVVPSAS